MRFYAYEEFKQDIKTLALKVQEEFEPEVLLAVARGGLTLGHFLAMHLNNRLVFSLNSIHYEHSQKLNSLEIFNIPDLSSYQKVLLVDDIIDSGETMQEIVKLLTLNFPQLKLKIASLFYKEKALVKPDFKVHKTDEWIEFFWERL